MAVRSDRLDGRHSDARSVAEAAARRRLQPFLFLELGLELGLERNDGDSQRLCDLQCGRHRPRCADDRRDRDQDVLNLLDCDAGVRRRTNVPMR